MEVTAMKTVFTSQRIAAGTVGPAMTYLAKEKRYPKRFTAQPPMVISNRGAERLLIRFSKFVCTNSLGHQTGVVARISCFVLNAPVRIQYRGNRNRTAMRIMTV